MDHTIPDTRCVCRECGHEIDVSFILCLFGKGPYRGWPRHCGRQVRMLSTTCDIDKSMEQALRPVKAQVEEVIARFGRDA
jgi:hypothetical protein